MLYFRKAVGARISNMTFSPKDKDKDKDKDKEEDKDKDKDKR